MVVFGACSSRLCCSPSTRLSFPSARAGHLPRGLVVSWYTWEKLLRDEAMGAAEAHMLGATGSHLDWQVLARQLKVKGGGLMLQDL